MKKVLLNIFISLSILFCICVCTGCSKKIKVVGIRSKVVKVVSGNEVELKNGLRVELLGIQPTEDTEKYLEKHVVGKEVKVISDSKQPQFIKLYKTKVKAYLKIKGDRYCIAGKMLLDRTATLRQTAVHDSLQSFISYARDEERRTMTLPELHTYLKDRTFKIVMEDGSGTGFFINDDGLALTNNHVYDGTEDAVVLFFGEGGTINTSDTRSAGKVIETNDGRYIDFTIFYVNLKNGEKVKYIPLIREHEKEGEKLAKLGSPLNETDNFQDGILSTYYDGFFTHNCGSGHGDSGSPIVNLKGEAVGINQSIEYDHVVQPDGSTVFVQSKISNAVDAVLIRDYLDEKGIKYGH